MPGASGAQDDHDVQQEPDELARRVLTEMPSLTRICLNEWTDITEASVRAVFRICPRLRELRPKNMPVGDAYAVVTRPSNFALSSWQVVTLPGNADWAIMRATGVQECHIAC